MLPHATHPRSFYLRPATLACLAAAFALAAKGQHKAADLSEISLEDLMNIEVTSVSKREGKLFSAPAAVYVITREDIRRSGLSSLPEILRMAPGVNVAQVDGSKWAISVRGFNGQFSRNLLVLIDGRAVYLPTHSGVYWDEQLLMIEDIDRIEIIRGPGATLWGANAVNGVINIITKSAADTQGGLVTARTGSTDQSVNAGRYGGKFGERGAYRAYVTHGYRENGGSTLGDELGWNTLQGGFRSDLAISERDTLTTTGSLFRESSRINARVPTLEPPFLKFFVSPEKASGGYVVANWEHRRSERSIFTVKGYVDHGTKTNYVVEDRTTLDLDFQHTWTPQARHDIVWGAGIRYNTTSFVNSDLAAFLPDHQTQRLYSAFVQDEIHLLPEILSLTVGSKFERNVFTGSEIQPGVRLMWTPSSRTSIWAAVSRAVRTPDYFEDSGEYLASVVRAPNGLPLATKIRGSRNLPAEALRAHEVGYRTQIGSRWTVDWTGFYNEYRRLRSYEQGMPTLIGDRQPTHLLLSLTADSKSSAESAGSEIMAAWNALSRWRLSGSYSYLSLQLHRGPGSRAVNAEAAERWSPRHQATFRSEMDLGRRFQFDTNVYHVAALTALNVPCYTRIDARLGWRPNDRLDLSGGVQNLQGGRHQEFVSEGPFVAQTVGRSLFLKASWSF
jgi:iron complex outermembrane receptor protein